MKQTHSEQYDRDTRPLCKKHVHICIQFESRNKHTILVRLGTVQSLSQKSDSKLLKIYFNPLDAINSATNTSQFGATRTEYKGND